MGYACANVFIDDVTTDRLSWMNSEVCRTILSAQIQPNATNVIRYVALHSANR